MNPVKIDPISLVMNAGLVVQCVLLLLFLFSISSWAVMILKFRYIRRAFKESSSFIDFFWENRDFSSAYAKAQKLRKSPVARIFTAGYLELKKSRESDPGTGFSVSDNIERALRRAINWESTKMVQMVPFLATTGNTTPFIGLFGTVWGIMNSFQEIGIKGSADLAAVAPGISEALVATAVGLLTAIPAVIAFNYFMQRIKTIESEWQSFSSDLLNIIERDILQYQVRTAKGK